MRLIDAEALKERKFVGVADWTPTEATSWQRGWNDAIDTIIEAQPTIEVEPVKKGKWIYDNQFHWYRASCSVCGYMRATDIKADNWNGWNYCPNCGARLTEGSEEC